MLQTKDTGGGMDELINFDALGDIVVNLTNKLAECVGWIVNRETPKKLAVSTYIKDIQESNYDPVTKAALISNAKKIIKEYCNQNDIVKNAIQSLQKQAEPEKVEDDWICPQTCGGTWSISRLPGEIFSPRSAISWTSRSWKQAAWNWRRKATISPPPSLTSSIWRSPWITENTWN